MAIKASGTPPPQLTFTEIRAEFPGEAAPYNLSEYYRGVSWVPASVGTTSIPSSGEIRFSDFFSTFKASTTQVGLTNGDIFNRCEQFEETGTASATANVTFNVVDNGTDIYITVVNSIGGGDTTLSSYYEKAAGGTQAMTIGTSYEVFRLNYGSGFYVKATGSPNSSTGTYSIINNLGESYTTVSSTNVLTRASITTSGYGFSTVDYRWTFSFSQSGSGSPDFTFTMDARPFAEGDVLF